jgi:hypothetical protein
MKMKALHIAACTLMMFSVTIALAQSDARKSFDRSLAGWWEGKVVIAMLDPNHHTEEWTFIDHGKEKREDL